MRREHSHVNRGCKLEILYLLKVLMSIPFNDLPWHSSEKPPSSVASTDSNANINVSKLYSDLLTAGLVTPKKAENPQSISVHVTRNVTSIKI